MFEVDEQSRLCAFVRLVHQDAALTEQGLEAFEDHVDGNIQQWVSRRQQFRLRETNVFSNVTRA